MKIETVIGDLAFEEVIGKFKGCEIYRKFDFEGVVYEFDRLAQTTPDGKIDITQVCQGEAFVKPGLIYKAVKSADINQKGERFQVTTDVNHHLSTSGFTPNKTIKMSQILGKLIGYYAFHWWRIATLRPVFELMNDRKENLFVFGGLYWTMGLIRWCLVSDKTFAHVLGDLSIGFIVTCALCIKPKQSLSLASAFLAASAAVDLMVTILMLAGITIASSWFYLLIEVLMYVTSLRAFYHAPGAVRVKDYKFKNTDL